MRQPTEVSKWKFWGMICQQKALGVLVYQPAWFISGDQVTRFRVSVWGFWAARQKSDDKAVLRAWVSWPASGMRTLKDGKIDHFYIGRCFCVFSLQFWDIPTCLVFLKHHPCTWKSYARPPKCVDFYMGWPRFTKRASWKCLVGSDPSLLHKHGPSSS